MTDQKDPSPLTAEQRRLVRQAVEDGIREGRMVEIHPIALAALLAALEEQEQTSAWCATHLRRTAAERASLREKLAATERRVEELERPRERLEPLAWADVLAAEARVDDLRARGVTGEELAKAETSMRIAKAAWGLDEDQRAAR